VLTRYANITIDDFNKVCSMGAAGFLKNDKQQLQNGLFIEKISEWIKIYWHSEERKQALLTLDKIIDENVVICKDPVAQWKASIESVYKTFDEYKKDGTLPFTPHIYYDLITDRLGVKTLITDPEARAEITSRATERYKNYLYTSRKEIGYNFSSLLENMANNRSYMNISKGLALKHYFDTLIAANSDIRQIVQ